MDDLMHEAASTVIDQCLAVDENENLVIVTDDGCETIGQSLYSYARGRDGETTLVHAERTGGHGNEPGDIVREALVAADVFVVPTMDSYTHTDARMAATAAGARGATMPSISEEVYTTSLLADYERIEERSQALFDHLEPGMEIRVTSPSGTDMTLDVWMETWVQDTGIIHEPGGSGNLPAGEIFGAPRNASGTIVIDSFELAGEQYAPPGTVVEIEDSHVTSVSNDCRLKEGVNEIENADRLAELGIGTNDTATLIGNMLQDEKVMGTVHFAFGKNAAFGGNTESPVHWDTVIEDPSIYFGEKPIMENGEFVIEV
ncbi:MAG: aminopeptidase [Candidatus Nanohaloarchaeota archaeon QJJ-5]|nr:aminopeptidase [Candidatus Nanohaloarchaeota archaeon QJJ-5]